MPGKPLKAVRKPLAACLAAAFAVWGPSADARVTKIVIDRAATPLAGDATYETITGRAFGELDPMDSHNSIISAIPLAPRTADGMVEYIATFLVVKPVDMSKSSGLLWHDVPNRAGRITISSDLRAQGDIGISSGWQGDNAGATALPANASSPTPVTPSANEWVKTPVLTGTTGMIMGRIVNRTGPGAQPLNVMGNPIPYFPATDQSNATLTTHTKETINGKITVGEVIPNSDWKFCGGGAFAPPTPVTTPPGQLLLKNAWGSTQLYPLGCNVEGPYL